MKKQTDLIRAGIFGLLLFTRAGYARNMLIFKGVSPKNNTIQLTISPFSVVVRELK